MMANARKIGPADSLHPLTHPSILGCALYSHAPTVPFRSVGFPCRVLWINSWASFPTGPVSCALSAFSQTQLLLGREGLCQQQENNETPKTAISKGIKTPPSKARWAIAAPVTWVGCPSNAVSCF